MREDQLGVESRLVLTEPPSVTVGTTVGMTFGEAVQRFLQVKASKCSIRDDRLNLARLERAFGTETPLVAITAGMVSAYKLCAPR